MKRIFLYSHGFATHADDNGLFDAVKNFFPDDEHIMFEYDTWDGEENIAATFSERKEKLREKFAEVRSAIPDAEIDLICHSQGCNIAALAQIEGAAHTILLAPNINYESGEREYEKHANNPKATVLPDRTIIRKRSGGYTTIIRPDYWNDYIALENLPYGYNSLNKITKLLIVDARHDTVIPEHKDYSLLDTEIQIRSIDSNHDMRNPDGTYDELESIMKDFLNK